MKVLETSRRYIKIWAHLAVISIKQKLQYKENAYIRFISKTIGFIVYLLFLDIIYGDRATFGGWTKFDMILLLGVYNTYLAVAESILFTNIRLLGENIYYAALDKYLIKPVSTIFLASFEKVHIYDMFDGVLGIVFIVYAFTHQHYDVSIAALVLVMLVMFMTTLLFASLVLTVMSLAFRGSRVDNAYWILDDLLKASAMPSQLHIGGFGIIFKFIIPITLIASVPVEIFKGVLDFKILFVYAAITAIWILIASRAWKDGLKRYTGAG